MEDQNIYQIEFSRKLNELGFTIHEGFENTFRLNLNENDLKVIGVKLIGSEPINERIHGTKNGTPIKAIGYFKFKLPHEENEPNFYIFAFTGMSDNKIEFVIISFTELKNRLNQRKCNTGAYQDKELQLWLLPDGYVFETTNIGAEGDWWFVGGRMAIGTPKDFTQFLNQWHLLEKCLKLND